MKLLIASGTPFILLIAKLCECLQWSFGPGVLTVPWIGKLPILGRMSWTLLIPTASDRSLSFLWATGRESARELWRSGRKCDREEMRRHDTYSPLRNGTAKQFKFCNRYAVYEYALERSVRRMEGRSREERCEEQTGSHRQTAQVTIKVTLRL